MTMADIYKPIWTVCKSHSAGRYGQPCTPVDGTYDGNTRKSCLYCGKWLEPENKS